MRKIANILSFIVAFIAFIVLAGEPEEGSIFDNWLIFILTKLMALGYIYIFSTRYR